MHYLTLMQTKFVYINDIYTPIICLKLSLLVIHVYPEYVQAESGTDCTVHNIAYTDMYSEMIHYIHLMSKEPPPTSFQAYV